MQFKFKIITIRILDDRFVICPVDGAAYNNFLVWSGH